ncbi:hypothetical protein [Haloechinothrix halophila]|uniref:hypothetical protein n=1 Tax=Haloechinothrix halophila TaxID=1069073 RepID=UPI000429B84D|nr:hypothetical protein [Haloechinothrix halophila]
MYFKLSGREFELDRALVHASLAGQSPEAIRDHWVEVDGQRWPPKQVLEAAIGVQRSEFTSHTALRQLRRLGFETSTMPTDDGRCATMAATTSSPIASLSGDVTNDTSRAAAAFQTLLSFVTSESLTERIAQLEADLQGADQPTAAAQAAASGLSDELLQASLLIRQHMGRISDVIHAAVITQALPLIIEEGERVTVRPSLAAGNDPGRPFDVETDRRVAEFKIQFWKGADAMRKRGTFKDLVHLALDESGRRAQLYVAGAHAIHFLRTSTSTADWALNRTSPILRERFEERFGTLHVRVCDFTSTSAAHVDLIDLTGILPALKDL